MSAPKTIGKKPVPPNQRLLLDERAGKYRVRICTWKRSITISDLEHMLTVVKEFRREANLRRPNTIGGKTVTMPNDKYTVELYLPDRAPTKKKMTRSKTVSAETMAELQKLSSLSSEDEQDE